MTAVGKTDIGKKREINEDSFFVYCDDERILCGCVADGMGGHACGEVASKMAVDIIEQCVKNDINCDMDYVEFGETVRKGFVEANYRIYRYAQENGFLNNMGNTATFAAIYRDKLITVHIGDSRVYAIDDGIVQITKDHSYVQELVLRGEITPEEAAKHPQKNYITRAMGIEGNVKVDVGIMQYSGESVLICSDGLTNMLTDDEIFEIVSENTDLRCCADELVCRANKKGGTDNITAVMLKK